MRCPGCNGVITEQNFMPVKVCPARGEKLSRLTAISKQLEEATEEIHTSRPGMIIYKWLREAWGLPTENKREYPLWRKVVAWAALFLFIIYWLIGLLLKP
tara:strand:+ start:363 stop:662 length:300 start_codon:yes stop_codon:yes gene_type:complete